jgi:predicted GNAT family N-acyltransferase
MKIVKIENSSDLEISHAIRKRVFVEEQRVPEVLELDNKDQESTSFLLYKEGEPIATTRVRKTDFGFKIERFAVLKEHRSKGVGGYFIENILLIILEENPKAQIYLHAQEAVESFYKNAGFVSVLPKFEEAGIMHVKMRYIPNISMSDSNN